MNESGNDFWQRNFSHIYVEQKAFDYPLTRELTTRFSQARVVSIKDYKSVFARPRQHFQTQKRSVNLILAVKKDQFVYKGSNHSQSFGLDNFYYNTLILNCLYNCDYCYLQGMYPSANIVVFVNLRDYFEATIEAIGNRSNTEQPLYLCISYDTDLLAFERVAPYCRKWIEFAYGHPDVLLEIRTKSALYPAIRDMKPTDRVILAWTFTPDAIADRYEHGAPPLRQRIRAARQAIDDGWQVRLCFDPLLAVAGWDKHYADLVEETFAKIPANGIRDATIGVFRMNTGYLDRIKKQRQDSEILFYPYEREENTVSYPAEQRNAMVDRMKQNLTKHLPEARIAVWT